MARTTDRQLGELLRTVCSLLGLPYGNKPGDFCLRVRDNGAGVEVVRLSDDGGPMPLWITGTRGEMWEKLSAAKAMVAAARHLGTIERVG